MTRELYYRKPQSKEYNGYKVYGKDGGQMPPNASNAVLKEVNLISDLTAIQVMDFEGKSRRPYSIVGRK